MERVEVFFPFSGEGHYGKLPRGARVVKAEEAEVQGRRVRIEDRQKGRVFFRWRGRDYCLIRTCLYYVATSREICEKGKVPYCYLCLLYQGLKRVKFSLREGQSQVSAASAQISRARYKCPYGYTLKGSSALNYFTKTLKPHRLKDYRRRGERATLLYFRESPLPMGVKIILEDRKKLKVKGTVKV